MPIDYGVTARLAYLQWLDSEETAEQEWIRVLRDYHAGNHPVYLTDRQKEFIGLEPRHSDHLFAHNLCSLIVATVAERMSVTGFTAGSVEDADAAPSPLALAASKWWEANRMDARQDDLYEMVLRDASAYLIVSWDADAGQPQWAMNQAYDGTQGVMVHTDPETDEVVFASKRWQMDWRTGGDNAGKTRLTLYFPDRVERYIQRDPKDRPDNDVDSEIMRLNWRTWRDAPGDPWPIWWTDDGTPIGDPLGMPVVAFDNPGGSEIDDVVSLQDLLNKSDLDLAAAADHSGFRITWASTGTMNINATGKQNDIRLAPGKMLELPEGSQLGSLEPADLSRMIATCHYWIESIAGQSRTPHYVLIPPGAEQPSGEALREQEIGLKSKCERKQRVWGNAWEDVLYLSARLANAFGAANLDLEERLQAQWDSVQSSTDMDKAQVAAAKQAAGVAAEYTWAEDLGMTAAEIERNKAQKAEAQQAQIATFGASAAQAARLRDQGMEV